jgi:hypothetical protein
MRDETRANGASENGSGRSDNGEAAAMEAVLQAVRTVEYGSVLVKIHQGKVVGIETSKKVRLDP